MDMYRIDVNGYGDYELIRGTWWVKARSFQDAYYKALKEWTDSRSEDYVTWEWTSEEEAKDAFKHCEVRIMNDVTGKIMTF